jgi:hypothetical protein
MKILTAVFSKTLLLLTINTITAAVTLYLTIKTIIAAIKFITMVLWIVTSDHIFKHGLALVGFSATRFEKVSRAANLARFRAHYGSNPIVYAQIWEDLQTTEIPEARIDNVTALDLVFFLMTINFLKCYTTEAQLAATFQVCERTARKWCWTYARKIQALKHQKVSLDLHLPSCAISAVY